MEIAKIIILFIIGIILLIKGGDFFVDAASWIAEISGIPKLIIGATIVSVATTLPEMFVSILAAAQGSVDLSIGNAIGSVTANLGLIMALALIFMPSIIKRKDYLIKSIIMVLCATIIVLCGLSGSIKIGFSIILLLLFAWFIFENVQEATRSIKEKKLLNELDDEDNLEKPKKDKKTVLINIIKFIGGAAGIFIGARLLVNSSTDFCNLLNIPERIIGVTVVAIGTSLPELITTLTAISKKQASLSAGNIIGANIMDLALIMPISSVIAGKNLEVSSISAMIDLPVCLLLCLLTVVPALIFKKFSRWQGFTILACYIAYTIATVFLF